MEEKISFESYLRQVLTPIIQEIIENALARHLPTPVAPSQAFPDIMDVKMTAKLLHLSVPTIYGLVHKQTIPYYKRGKHLLFKRDDLEKWIAGSRRQTVDEIRADALNSLAGYRRKR